MKKITSVLLCLVLLSLTLVACSSVGAAGSVLDTELSLIKQGKFSEVSIFSDSLFANEDADMLGAMYAKFKYKVGKEQIAENSAAVDVTITMVDMRAAFTAYVNEAKQHFDDPDWDAEGSYFVELLRSGDIATKEFAITVNMVKVDEAWTIIEEDNEDLLDALTGGLVTSLDSLADLFS